GLAEPFAQLPIDCEELATQPAAVRKRAIGLALERAGHGYDAVHLDAIDALVTAPTAGERSIDLPGGRAVRSYESLEIQSDRMNPTAELIQSDRSSPEYEVRVWKAGDRMKPARLKGR